MRHHKGRSRLIRMAGHSKRLIRLGVAVAMGASAITIGVGAPAGGAPTGVNNADPGITKDEIAVGFPTVLSGPAANIVRYIRVAHEAYFKELNEKGGVNGRTLKAVVEDAGTNDAVGALTAVTKLKDEAFIIETNDGTIFGPLAERFKLPTFSFSTEAAGLHNKYGFETQTYAAYQARELLPDYLLHDLDAKNKTVAVIYQPDNFTLEANDVFMKAAKKKGIDVVIDQPIDVNAPTCAQEVSNVAQKKPDITVVLALRSALCAFREMGAQGVKTNVTGIGGTWGVNVFLNASPGLLEGATMFGLFPPLSQDPNDKCSADYLRIMKKQQPDVPQLLTDEPAYSGYLVNRHTVMELEKYSENAGKNPTREGFVKFLSKQKNFDDGCLAPVSYGPGDKRQGATSVYLWEVTDNKFTLKDSKLHSSF